MKRIPNTNLFLPDTQTPEVIDLDALIAQRNELISRQAMSEPTDEELIAYGKMMHPYFSDAMTLQMQIDNLNSQIDELENIV